MITISGGLFWCVSTTRKQNCNEILTKRKNLTQAKIASGVEDVIGPIHYFTNQSERSKLSRDSNKLSHSSNTDSLTVTKREILEQKSKNEAVSKDCDLETKI